MKFVIYGPHYEDTAGGVIALYKLCRVLSDMGHDAKIWHWTRYHPFESRVINGKFSTYFAYADEIKVVDDFHEFTYEHASLEDVDDSIVVYPEIVEGNPLGARRVVRWLLNAPGALSGTAAYGVDELFFHYSEVFVPKHWEKLSNRELRLEEWMTDTYAKTNFGPRDGVCYMIRKGYERPLDSHPAGAILVDDLSHHEVAAVFNRCEQFISYDIYTAYTTYAALCGCDSIVVPSPEIDPEEWRRACPSGVAYGFDDVARARRTVPDLIMYIDAAEGRNYRMVMNFLAECREYFKL